MHKEKKVSLGSEAFVRFVGKMKDKWLRSDIIDLQIDYKHTQTQNTRPGQRKLGKHVGWIHQAIQIEYSRMWFESMQLL